MNLLVLIRPLRDPASFIVNRRAQKVFINKEHYIINPADLNALEAALQLAHAPHRTNGHSNSVTVVAFGEALADDYLRDALARGADRALHIKDGALKDADAGVLTAAIQQIADRYVHPDVILLGGDVLDADLAQIAPRLAQALNRPYIENTHALTVDDHVITATVKRANEFQRIEAVLPAVIAIARDSNKPRLAPGNRIITVYQDKNAVEVLTCNDLGLGESDLAPAVTYRGDAFDPDRELGKRLTGSTDELAKQVVEIIRKA